MESSDQHLLHTRNRPIRVAFIVDTSSKIKALARIEKVIDYAAKKWGGRFFQIIPSSNGNISDAWVEYLEQYDPDFIHAKTKLSKATVKKIALRLNPSFIEIDEREFISLHPDPIDVLPDASNSAFLWRNPFQEYSIFNLNLSEQSTPPAYVRKFVKFNFGQLSGDYFTKRLVDGHVVQKEVSSKATLINGMGPLAEWNRHIYPLEYSFIPGVDREIKRDDYDGGAVRTLFIGDDPLDVIHYWNSALRAPDWLSYQMINAWVPTKFMTDDQLLTVLRGWMDKFRTTGNSNDPQKLNIRSASINLGTLRVYARKISENLYYSTNVQKINQPEKISYRKHIAVTADMESYSVSGNAFNLSVKPVNQMQGGMLGQQWMTDFYIEQVNPDSRIMNPSKYWLLFPKYNALAYQTLNLIGSRVGHSGQPSTFMSRDTGMMSLTIPNDRTILDNLLLGSRHFNYHNGDPREKVLDPPFSNYRYSQSGRSLRGFVNLFGGFMEASHFFENPYWRRVFMTMAGEDPAGDSALNKSLRNALEKNLKKVIGQGNVSEKAVDTWVSRVQKYSRDLKLEGQEKDFNFFESEFLREIEEYNKANGKNIKYTDRNKRGLKDNLSGLIDIKMLRIGVRHKCHHCGLKSFYEVSDLKPHNECVGCSAEFTVNAEQTWHYQLNTIAGVNGAIYSQIPLIVAMGALYEHSRYSFDSYSPVDIFVGKRERHLTDLDIFVLLDGKLVIGEVKNVQTLFTDGDFDKLYKAAKLLRPDVVVLSSLDRAPDVNNQKRMTELQAKLKSSGVEVKWLNLSPMVFELYPQGIWSW